MMATAKERELVLDDLVAELDEMPVGRLLWAAMEAGGKCIAIMLSPDRDGQDAALAVFAVANPNTIRRVHECLGPCIACEDMREVAVEELFDHRIDTGPFGAH